jgi:hypothetical protein
MGKAQASEPAVAVLDVIALAAEKKPKKRSTEVKGVRLVNGRIYDDVNGTSCHQASHSACPRPQSDSSLVRSREVAGELTRPAAQCRQKTLEDKAPCGGSGADRGRGIRRGQQQHSFSK